MTDVRKQAHYGGQEASVVDYFQTGVQPIEYMASRMSKEKFAGYLEGCVTKYIARYEEKDGVKDLHKARVYLNWLIEVQEGFVLDDGTASEIMEEMESDQAEFMENMRKAMDR